MKNSWDMYVALLDAVEKSIQYLLRREVEEALNLLTAAKQVCEDIYVEKS